MGVHDRVQRGDQVAKNKEPNRRLAAVMEEAGASNKGLAARVRELANRDGRSSSADHVAVRRWLDGTMPKASTQQYIALALGSKLGRRITPEDIGFSSSLQAVGPDATEDGNEYPEHAAGSVERLSRLTAADLEDQPALLRSDWSSSATPGIITGYLFGQALHIVTSADTASGGFPAANAIRATASHLMDLDFQYGGGHVRKLLLFYFKSEVAPLLRQSHPERERRALFSAAAEVAQLLGWSAYDSGRHGAAQRYFIQGLRLAREANDHMLGGRLLSNLSHQANYLGRFNEAVQYARAAQSAVIGNCTPTVNSMFLAMEARALASAGDRKGVASVLNQAEQLFERSNPTEDPQWIRYFNAEELAGEAAHCFRDLRIPEETRLFAERAVAPDNTPPRTRAFIGMVTAAGALTSGDLDEAVSLAATAVDLAGPLQSSRYVRYLTDFYQILTEQHIKHPLTETFAERVLQHYPDLSLAAMVHSLAA
jgi:tetratricopeptide (TPR) repeat protein